MIIEKVSKMENEKLSKPEQKIYRKAWNSWMGDKDLRKILMAAIHEAWEGGQESQVKVKMKIIKTSGAKETARQIFEELDNLELIKCIAGIGEYNGEVSIPTLKGEALQHRNAGHLQR